MCQDEITPIISKLRTRPVRCKTYLQPDPDFYPINCEIHFTVQMNPDLLEITTFAL